MTVLTARRTFWGLAAAGGVATATWWFGDKAPYPYVMHAFLDIPLPYLTCGCLDEVLRPRPGERILEIGPGTGVQSLHVAPQLGPSGRLDIVDIQPDMLDHVTRRADERGITNITATESDARDLPFGQDVFDAVYLVTALGEIPEPDRVLREAAVSSPLPDGWWSVSSSTGIGSRSAVCTASPTRPGSIWSCGAALRSPTWPASSLAQPSLGSQPDVIPPRRPSGETSLTARGRMPRDPGTFHCAGALRPEPDVRLSTGPAL